MVGKSIERMTEEAQDGRLGADRAQLEFTWDPRRAQSNVVKHGVSFVQADTGLLDALELTVFDATHTQDEDRWFTLWNRPQWPLQRQSSCEA